jgi:hypothetical protein
VPGFPDAHKSVDRIVAYLADQHSGLYWIDKWHISPLYATAHTLLALDELSPEQARPVADAMRRSRDWLRYAQNADGSWGFYGQPTTEETAYGLLALCAGQFDERDRGRCAKAADYLQHTKDDVFPALWIDKCLYTPPLIVRAAIDAALAAWHRKEPTRPCL